MAGNATAEAGASVVGPADGGNVLPAGACGTEQVREVFRGSCASAGCHSNVKPAAALDLSVADPALALLEVSSTLCASWSLVSAGDLQTSLLWQKLSDSSPPCGEPMPITNALDAASLACIASWIENPGSGAQDCESCGGADCVDLESDAQHCGDCDTACAANAVCESGQCHSCGSGQTACGTSCVDLLSDANNCSACGTVCGGGEMCDNGSCGCAVTANVSFTVDATQCSDARKLVDPGNPANSYLLSKLNGQGMCSGALMPKGDPAWTQAELDTLASWICAGAPKN